MWEDLYAEPNGGNEFRLSQKRKFKNPANFEGKKSCRRKSGIIQQGVSSLYDQ